jgi:hypothetical protein
MEGALLLTLVLTAGLLGSGLYGAGEDVGSLGELVADDVRVHPQGDRGIGMAEPGGDHMHRDASQQQGRGVDVPQIMQPGVRLQAPSGVPDSTCGDRGGQRWYSSRRAWTSGGMLQPGRGGSVSGSAVALRARRRRQVGRPRFRRSAVPTVTLRRWSRLPDRAWPVLRARHPLPLKITVKGAPCGRVATAMGASAHP